MIIRDMMALYSGSEQRFESVSFCSCRSQCTPIVAGKCLHLVIADMHLYSDYSYPLALS